MTDRPAIKSINATKEAITLFDSLIQRAEAAEARCAQLTQELSDANEESRQWRVLREFSEKENTALQAEHERLRAALESIRSHCICGAALGLSHEPTA